LEYDKANSSTDEKPLHVHGRRSEMSKETDWCSVDQHNHSESVPAFICFSASHLFHISNFEHSQCLTLSPIGMSLSEFFNENQHRQSSASSVSFCGSLVSGTCQAPIAALNGLLTN